MKRFAYILGLALLGAGAQAWADERTTVKKRVGIERQPNPFEAYLGRPIGYDTDGYGLYSTDRIEQLIRAAAEKAKSECSDSDKKSSKSSATPLFSSAETVKVECAEHESKVKYLLRKTSTKDQIRNAAVFAEVSAVASVAGVMGCDMTKISEMILDH